MFLVSLFIIKLRYQAVLWFITSCVKSCDTESLLYRPYKQRFFLPFRAASDSDCLMIGTSHFPHTFLAGMQGLEDLFGRKSQLLEILRIGCNPQISLNLVSSQTSIYGGSMWAVHNVQRCVQDSSSMMPTGILREKPRQLCKTMATRSKSTN